MSYGGNPRDGGYGRSGEENQKLRAVQAKANEVTDIARDNIRMSIAQVDKLQDMEEKAQNLESSSQDFHRGAKRVRRMMCVRSWKMLALIILAVIILLVIIIAPIAVSMSPIRAHISMYEQDTDLTNIDETDIMSTSHIQHNQSNEQLNDQEQRTDPSINIDQASDQSTLTIQSIEPSHDSHVNDLPASSSIPIHPFFQSMRSPSERSSINTSERSTPASSRSTLHDNNISSPSRRSKRNRKNVERYSPSISPITQSSNQSHDHTLYEVVPLIVQYSFKCRDVNVAWKLNGDVVSISSEPCQYINQADRAELLGQSNEHDEGDLNENIDLNDPAVIAYSQHVAHDAQQRVEAEYREFECNFSDLDDDDEIASLEAEHVNMMNQPLYSIKTDSMNEIRLIDWDPRPSRFAYLYPSLRDEAHENLVEIDERDADDIADALGDDEHVIPFKKALTSMIEQSTNVRLPLKLKPRLIQSMLSSTIPIDVIVDIRNAAVISSESQPMFLALTLADLMLIRRLTALIQPFTNESDITFRSSFQAIAVLDMLLTRLQPEAIDDTALCPMIKSLCMQFTIINQMQFQQSTYRDIQHALVNKLTSWKAKLDEPVLVDE